MGKSMKRTMARAPWHLWVVGVIAVLFNSIGVFDFIMFHLQGAEYLAKAGMTPAQIDHTLHQPTWMMWVWGIGVFSAFAASVMLLMRRKAAAGTFFLSLVVFLVSVVYTYHLSDGGKVMGHKMAITSGVIALLLLLFGNYAAWAKSRGLMR